MDHETAGRFWEANAEAWTRLARAGCDRYRDLLNTPAFLALLPEVSGRSGLDIGCGEGHNTRLLADAGARMHAIDISESFVRHAEAAERAAPRGIAYCRGSAVALPFADRTFDFATGFMSLMDVPETEGVLSEAFRVLRPGGFLQFSITHPCFDTPHRKNLRDRDGRTYAVEVGRYFERLRGEVAEWIFRATPQALRRQLPAFRIPVFNRTLSSWINAIIDAGFVLERVQEPRPNAADAAAHPELQDAGVVAYFLHLRCRKPERAGR